MSFLLSWYVLIPLLLGAAFFAYFGRTRRWPRLWAATGATRRISWEETRARIAIPITLLLILFLWWLLTRNSSASWAMSVAGTKPALWAGLVLLLVIAGYLLAIPQTFERNPLRKILLFGSLAAGTLLLVFTLFPRANIFARSVERLVKKEAAYPEPLTPVFASAPCRDPYTMPIPDSLTVRDSVAWEGAGVYRLFFTGGEIHNLLSGYNWPEDLSYVWLSVSPVRSNQHLDRTGYWDPATGEHLTASISKRRNYTPGHPESAGYCPGQLDSYPFSQTLRYYLGPNQTAAVVEPAEPRRGVYPFSGGPVRVRIRPGENPVLLFNNGIPAANRLHRVEFLVTIRPT